MLNKKEFPYKFLDYQILPRSACLKVMHSILIGEHKKQRVQQWVLVQVSTPSDILSLMFESFLTDKNDVIIKLAFSLAVECWFLIFRILTFVFFSKQSVGQ